MNVYLLWLGVFLLSVVGSVLSEMVIVEIGGRLFSEESGRYSGESRAIADKALKNMRSLAVPYSVTLSCVLMMFFSGSSYLLHYTLSGFALVMLAFYRSFLPSALRFVAFFLEFLVVLFSLKNLLSSGLIFGGESGLLTKKGVMAALYMVYMCYSGNFVGTKSTLAGIGVAISISALTLIAGATVIGTRGEFVVCALTLIGASVGRIGRQAYSARTNSDYSLRNLVVSSDLAGTWCGYTLGTMTLSMLPWTGSEGGLPATAVLLSGVLFVQLSGVLFAWFASSREQITKSITATE